MKQKPFVKLIVNNLGKVSPTTGEHITGDGSFDLPAIIDSLEDELIVIDRDYHIVEANNAVLLRHEKQMQEVIG